VRDDDLNEIIDQWSGNYKKLLRCGHIDDNSNFNGTVFSTYYAMHFFEMPNERSSQQA
jgi:hypothetical protein